MKTRKLLAAFLVIVMCLGMLPAAVFAADFNDTQGHWGQAAIERWAGYGVLNGDETGNFNPDKSMTRAEFSQMLSKMMGYTEKSENTFTDVPANAWYADAMLKLVGAGVMNGMGDGTLAPDAPISREQTAVLLCRALDIKPTPNASIDFSDSGNVSSWAKDAVAALTERGMINGMGDGTFAPALDINRASVSQMVSNMVSEYVTEDGATITGEVKGIVLIKADNVKIENATLSEPVIVTPAAAAATVSLTGSTSAADVVVAAEGAKVVVAETATAKAVEVEAPRAGAEIAGKVDSVAVTEKAADAAVSVSASGSVDSISSAGTEAKVNVAGTVKAVTVTGANAAVTVAKGAEVDSVTSSGTGAKVNVAGTVKAVTVTGSKTNVDVSGKVEKVDVAASASDTGIRTEAGAMVDSVTAASNVTVTGASGTVGSVTATGEADAKVDVPKAEVKNEGSGSVTAGSKPVDSGKTETVPSTGGGAGGAGGGGGGGSSGGGGGGGATVAVTGVTLNKTTLSLEVGKTETLTATVAPSNATNKSVKWSSSDTSVATVSNGTVTAVKEGTATITVASSADASKTATCAVTVTPASAKSIVDGILSDGITAVNEKLVDGSKFAELAWEDQPAGEIKVTIYDYDVTITAFAADKTSGVIKVLLDALNENTDKVSKISSGTGNDINLTGQEIEADEIIGFVKKLELEEEDGAAISGTTMIGKLNGQSFTVTVTTIDPVGSVDYTVTFVVDNAAKLVQDAVDAGVDTINGKINNYAQIDPNGTNTYTVTITNSSTPIGTVYEDIIETLVTEINKKASLINKIELQYTKDTDTGNSFKETNRTALDESAIKKLVGDLKLKVTQLSQLDGATITVKITTTDATDTTYTLAFSVT